MGISPKKMYQKIYMFLLNDMVLILPVEEQNSSSNTIWGTLLGQNVTVWRDQSVPIYIDQ